MCVIPLIYTSFWILLTALYKMRIVLRCSDTGIVGWNTGSSGHGYLSAFFLQGSDVVDGETVWSLIQETLSPFFFIRI
jgi:hypothetical protein